MAFWGRKKEDEGAKLKAKQIEQFETFNPAAKGNPQKTIYNVPVPTAFGQLVFQVNLETGFPERAPQLRVLQRVMHPWVDRELNILHPKLGTGWSAHHSLGQICREVAAEFTKNPPQPAQSIMQMPVQVQPPAVPPIPSYTPGGVPPSLPHSVGAPGGAAAGGGGGALPMDPAVAAAMAAMQHQHMQPPVPSSQPTGPSPHIGAPGSNNGGAAAARQEPIRMRLPEIPQQFTKLDSLTIAQLEELNKNAGSLQDMVDNMETVQSMTSVRDGMDNDVEQIANNNLARRADISRSEAELTATRARLTERQAVLTAMAARQQAVLQRYSPAAIIAALDVTIENAEDAADKLKKEYQDMDADEDRDEDKGGSDDEKEAKDRGRAAGLSHAKFCTEFVKLRTVAHMRMAKKERLQEIYGKS